MAQPCEKARKHGGWKDFRAELTGKLGIDSHLMSKSDAAKRLRKVNLPEDASPFEQGAQLIEYANAGIVALIDSLSKGLS